MMKQCVHSVILGSVAIVAMGATTVFDNTTGPTGPGPYNVLLASGEANSPEHANIITLASYQRVVRTFILKMQIGGQCAASFKLHVRFYKPDGPGGAPGTLL